VRHWLKIITAGRVGHVWEKAAACSKKQLEHQAVPKGRKGLSVRAGHQLDSCQDIEPGETMF
jgi:hypothetical protein